MFFLCAHLIPPPSCCLEGCYSSHLRPQWSHYRSGHSAGPSARSWCGWSCRWKYGRWRTRLLRCRTWHPQRRPSPTEQSWCSSPEPLSQFQVCKELREGGRKKRNMSRVISPYVLWYPKVIDFYPAVLPELNSIVGLGKLEQISSSATTWTK